MSNDKNILPFPSSPGTLKMDKVLLGLVPFTPVALTGATAPLAWGRIAGYGIAAALVYGKSKPLSYSLMAAAAISFSTSITAGLWNMYIKG